MIKYQYIYILGDVINPLKGTELAGINSKFRQMSL